MDCFNVNYSNKIDIRTFERGTRDKDVKFLPEEKTILGYECQKAIVTDELGSETTVFYTTRLKPLLTKDNGWKRLKGLVLSREFYTPQGTVFLDATDIKKRKPKKQDLMIPR